MGARGTEFYTSHIGEKTNISVLSGAVSITSYKTVLNEDGTTKQITLNVVLENNQHMTLETKPEELFDMIQEELTLEKLDLFALEIIKEIAENEPELAKPEFIEKVDEIIENKKQEKKQKEEEEKIKEEERNNRSNVIEYDEQLQEDDSYNNDYNDGTGSDDDVTPIVFTVVFDSQGGSNVDSITVEKNAKITPPEDPVKEGYTFAGWYKEPECVNAWNFEEDVITGNVTIYAKWEIKSFTVTFASPEGEVYSQTTVEYGSKVEQPEEPVKEGYTFAGWYKEPECINAWDFETDVVTDNITLYAKWEPGIKPAVELVPETNRNFVDYELRITFAPDDDFANSITSVKVKHSNYSDEFIELDEGVTWNDGDYYIDTEIIDGCYAIVLNLYRNKGELNIPGTLTVRVEATGYEVSEVEQIIYPQPDSEASSMEILLNGEPVYEEELDYGNTYTVELTAMGIESIDSGNIVPIENMQFNLNIFVYAESDEYAFQIDGDYYGNGEYEYIPLKSKTDGNGKVTFEITIPEDLPDHAEAFYIEICYGTESAFELFGFYEIYFRYEDIPW